MSIHPTTATNPFADQLVAFDDDLVSCGLFCPDDALDDVMVGSFLPILGGDDGRGGFLDALGAGGGGVQYPHHHAPRNDAGRRGGGAVVEPLAADDFDVDMFFADDAPDDGGGGGAAVPSYAPSYHAPAVASAPPAAVARGVAAPCGAGNTYLAPPPVVAPEVFDFHGDVFATVSAPPLLPPRDLFDAVPAPPPLLPPRDLFGPVSAPPPLPGYLFDPVSAPPPLPQPPARNPFDGVLPVAASSPRPPHDALAGALLPYCATPLPGASTLVPYCAPPLPAHDNAVPALPPPATTSRSSGTSSSGCSASSMATWSETDSPPRVASPLRASWLLLPRRKRTRPITRRNYGWLPNCQLHAALPPPPPQPPRATSLNATGNSKRPVQKPRQRNRQRERSCSHCSTTQTPQWRAGPLGPGTLCNACGIRYKQQKGKLLEAYRPSTSPTFDSGKHSNRQRKVIKIMERKQALLKQAAAPPVPSCGGGGEFMDVCTYISTG